MKKVLIFEPIHPAGIERLKEEPDIEVSVCADISVPKIYEEVAGVEAIIVRSSKVGRDILEAARNLKVIGRHGAGVDNIDMETATKKSIAVVNTPEANIQSVAEHAVMCFLVLARKAIQSNEAVRKGLFSGERASLAHLAEKYGFVGQELYGQCLGIVGLGHIGRKVAEICKLAFQMDVLAYDPYVGSVEVELVKEVDELFTRADFVSLHLPLTSATRGFVGERELRLMKKEAFLINTSRGGIVDERALVDALEKGVIAGAAVDVYEQEPPPQDHPFFSCKNLLLTPHNAAITENACKRMAIDVVDGVLDFLKGRRPKYLVS